MTPVYVTRYSDQKASRAASPSLEERDRDIMSTDLPRFSRKKTSNTRSVMDGDGKT